MKYKYALAIMALFLVLGGGAGGQPAVPPDRVLFADDFEKIGTDSTYWWEPLGGQWAPAQRATRVLRQSSDDLTLDCWNIAFWANYTVVTKCLAEEGEGPWGIGLTAYDDMQGRHYRLRLGEGRLFMEKVNGPEVHVLQETEAKASRGKWLSLRLALYSRPESTILLGRLWSGDEEEPKEWAIRTEDNRQPYHGGSVGLWTGSCPGRFLYLSARQYDLDNDKSGELLYGTDFSEVRQGYLPLFWLTRGGLWLRDLQVDKQAALRQIQQPGDARYDENAAAAFCWTGYEVSVRAVAHPGTTKWGVGLVAYYGPEGSNYRLRTLDNRLLLVKRRPDGRVENLAALTLLSHPLQRGRWYRLRFALDNLPGAVRLQGKIWEDDADEPPGWQISAYDQNAPLRGGAPGLWCYGAPVDFDDFLVRTTPLSALNDLLQ